MSLFNKITLRDMPGDMKRSLMKYSIAIAALYLLFPQKLAFLEKSLIAQWQWWTAGHILAIIFIIIVYWLHRRIF